MSSKPVWSTSQDTEQPGLCWKTCLKIKQTLKEKEKEEEEGEEGEKGEGEKEAEEEESQEETI